MRFRLLPFLIPLVACMAPADINGTYDGAMTRSSEGCVSPGPTSTSAQVQIVDTSTAHVVHIFGDRPCDLQFRVDDYGGIGQVIGVAPGCTLQPVGMTFTPGSSLFSPEEIRVQWSPAGGSSCLVTDSWTLGK